MTRLGARTLSELIRFALQEGLIVLPPSESGPE